MKATWAILLAHPANKRATLQVPDIAIQLGGEPDRSQDHVEDFPDEWFELLNGGIPSRQGVVYWSRAGWEANSPRIIATFAEAGGVAETMALAAARHFEHRDRMIADEKLRLQRRMAAMDVEVRPKRDLVVATPRRSTR